MSSPAEALGAPGAIPPEGDRRQHQRHRGKAKVVVLREGDNWRTNLPVELIDISIAGLGLLTSAPIALDERVRIRLQHDIRRFIKEVRGVVRWTQLTDTGKLRLGIVLHSRLSSLDIQLLKQLDAGGESGQKVWV